jgi:ATP-dependent Clp protease adaptor protein ClpS
MTKEKSNPSEQHQGQEDLGVELILFNDEVNTFDFVIETLIDVCHHQPEQAEQCAMIAHMKGRCAVRNGSYEVLAPMKSEMLHRGLTVSIE